MKYVWSTLLATVLLVLGFILSARDLLVWRIIADVSMAASVAGWFILGRQIGRDETEGKYRGYSSPGKPWDG
jgi:hypothetical protein